jgi:hypothetical protein
MYPVVGREARDVADLEPGDDVVKLRCRRLRPTRHHFNMTLQAPTRTNRNTKIFESVDIFKDRAF